MAADEWRTVWAPNAARNRSARMRTSRIPASPKATGPRPCTLSAGAARVAGRPRGARSGAAAGGGEAAAKRRRRNRRGSSSASVVGVTGAGRRPPATGRPARRRSSVVRTQVLSASTKRRLTRHATRSRNETSRAAGWRARSRHERRGETSGLAPARSRRGAAERRPRRAPGAARPRRDAAAAMASIRVVVTERAARSGPFDAHTPRARPQDTPVTKRTAPHRQPAGGAEVTSDTE